MTETKTAGISSNAKIIVGASHSESTGWYSLHLHNALFALSVRPDQELIVVDEGQGRHRLQHMTFPFANVLGLKVCRWPYGDDCLNSGVDDNSGGDTVAGQRSFAPVMVQLLIRHTTRTDFVSIHDVGATPTPFLIPQLKVVSAERMKTAGTELACAEDCATLADKVEKWVLEVNMILRKEKVVRRQIAAAAKPLHYDKVEELVDGISLSNKDVQQTLYGVVAALIATIHLDRYRKQRQLTMLRRPARIESSFPIMLMKADNEGKKNLSVEDLCNISQRYYEETNRPISEAFTTISDQLKDFKSRKLTIDSSDKLSIIEDIAPRRFEITDPTIMINEGGRVFDGFELQHKEQLERVLKNEGLDVHYIEGLPFLSLLVSYETEDDERCYAVVIKEEPHPALKQFLLAHEMGHWFLHIKNKERNAGVAPFLRSSSEETFLEKEADIFGLSVLFPPEYLSDWVFLKGEEPTIETVFDEFVAGMTPPPGDRLKSKMLEHIGEILEKHQSFKKAQEPKLWTFDESIEEKDLQPMLDRIHKGNDNSYWVRLDSNSYISDASDNVEALFGRSKDELRGQSPLELVIEKERERMGLRTQYRKSTKKAINYMTEVVNTTTNRSRPVMVYSFPILSQNQEYVGAMAAIRPLDQLTEQPDQ
jgi:PAS domain S-box-containing protein